MYSSERVDVQRRFNGCLVILGARGRMVAIASVTILCNHVCGSSQARSNKGSPFRSLGGCVYVSSSGNRTFVVAGQCMLH